MHIDGRDGIIFLSNMKGEIYMPKVQNVEKRIFEIEGFQVDITKDGKNVRGDLRLPKHY